MRPPQGESYFFDRFKIENKGKPLFRKICIEGLGVYIESGEEVNLLSVEPEKDKRENTGKKSTEENLVWKTDS